MTKSKKHSIPRIIKPRQPFHVTNLVVTTDLCEESQSIHMGYAANTLPGKVDVSVFPAVSTSCRKPRATNSMFESSKCVTAGATRFEDALFTTYQMAWRHQQDFRIPTIPRNAVIQNLILAGQLGYAFDVNRFYHDHKLDCSFNPNDFKGMNYTVPGEDNMVLVLFDTGAVNCVGTKDVSLIPRAQAVTRMLVRYRVGIAEELPSEKHRTTEIAVKAQTKSKSKRLRSKMKQERQLHRIKKDRSIRVKEL